MKPLFIRPQTNSMKIGRKSRNNRKNNISEDFGIIESFTNTQQ